MLAVAAQQLALNACTMPRSCFGVVQRPSNSQLATVHSKHWQYRRLAQQHAPALLYPTSSCSTGPAYHKVEPPTFRPLCPQSQGHSSTTPSHQTHTLSKGTTLPRQPQHTNTTASGCPANLVSPPPPSTTNAGRTRPFLGHHLAATSTQPCSLPLSVRTCA